MVTMAPINLQQAGMGIFVFVYFVFYLLLKCDIIEETLVAHRKCKDYQIGTHLSNFTLIHQLLIGLDKRKGPNVS